MDEGKHCFSLLPFSNIAFQVQTRNIIVFLANYLSSSDKLVLTVSDPNHNELFVEKRDLEWIVGIVAA